MRGLVSVGLLLALAGCAAAEIEPEVVRSPQYVAPDGGYSLELPVGWKRAEQALTFDGWERQAITFNAGPVLDGTVDASAPGLLAAMRDQLAQQPGVELLECRAATLGGLQGFRMQYRSTAEPPPPRVEVVVYGAVDGPMLYAFSLESREPATFARDLEVFERLVASFRRTEPPPAAR